MKKLLILIMLLSASIGCYAQQDPKFSQFFISGLGYNPAYAGSRDALSGVLFYRTQWVGIEGGPKTYFFQGHSPVSKNFSVGLNAMHDKVGIFSTNHIFVSGAYRLELNEGNLQFGMQGGFRNYDADLSKVTTFIPGDPAFTGRVNSWKPNVGVGLYYFSERLKLSLSAPYLIKENLKTTNADGTSIKTEQDQHLFLGGAYIFDVSETFKFRPGALVKYVKDAPMQLDLNAAFIYDDVFLFGASLRNVETLSAIFQVWPKSNWYLGYSYDYSINGLNPYNNGSHEIYIGFDLGVKRSLAQSPRYF
jgi:type IX secretion system PorP/SprF family membrane protein